MDDLARGEISRWKNHEHCVDLGEVALCERLICNAILSAKQRILIANGRVERFERFRTILGLHSGNNDAIGLPIHLVWVSNARNLELQVARWISIPQTLLMDNLRVIAPCDQGDRMSLDGKPRANGSSNSTSAIHNKMHANLL